MGYATKEQAARLIELMEAQKQARADYMPTEKDALNVLFTACERLKELGWKDIIYCPKDGSIFEAIEIGSTGIFDCIYQGEWPHGSWWVMADGDMYPSHPILYRLKAEAHEKMKQILKEQAEAYYADHPSIEDMQEPSTP